ncbi:MAG: DUF134 domain-containing protein [Deltaproteobacteria bacterium]|jgi:uncharacterized protein|nr:DUF134 domain-containing protein [Deltaproteobacteria bacterium]
MVRPQIQRRVSGKARISYFKPQGIPLAELEELGLTLDGLEALRLADVEGMYHDAAAERMGVSRPTFGRILAQARCAVATAISQGKALRIEGGVVVQAPKRGGCGRRGDRCRRGWGRNAGKCDRRTQKLKNEQEDKKERK